MNVPLLLIAVLIHVQILLEATHVLVDQAIVWQVMDGLALVRMLIIYYL